MGREIEEENSWTPLGWRGVLWGMPLNGIVRGPRGMGRAGLLPGVLESKYSTCHSSTPPRLHGVAVD